SLTPLQAQDTVRVSLEEFVKQGIKNSGQIDAKKQEIFLAKNRVDQVKGERFLTSFTLTTAHGLVPNTEGETQEGSFQYDFEDLSLYTQARIELLQPIFTWGALRNAVKAS